MVTFCLLDALLCEATYPLPCNRRRDYRHLLRGCAGRSGFPVWSGLPAVACPGLADEPAGDDDGVGQRDERLDDDGSSLSADEELLEAPVVP